MTTAADPVLLPPRSRALRKLRAHPAAPFGAALFVFFVVIAVVGPILLIADPTHTDWGAVGMAPSAAHWLGADEIGRDLLSRMMWGGHASLMAGVVSFAIGVQFGVAAGYLRGWTDVAISRMNEALLAVPFLILAIALAAFLGSSLGNAMIAIGLSAMLVFVRLARVQAMGVLTEDYVESARAVGLPTLGFLGRYIPPNILPPILVQAMLTVATAIIAEASPSFLRLGQQPPAPSWSSMLNTAKNFLDQAPWMAMWPGLVILLAVLGCNLIGDGLREAVDARDI